MLSMTVRHGSSRASWNTYPSRAAAPSFVTEIDPEVGSSTPDRMFSSVDLPQPDGPTSDTNVCPDSPKLSPPSACTAGRSLRVAGKTLVRFSMVSVAMRSSCLCRVVRSCAALQVVARGRAPAERPPRHPLQDELVEEHDEHDEEHDPRHEPREVVRVVPRARLVADALAP